MTRSASAAGPAVRALIAPAGHGKTTAVQAAAEAHRLAGRPVLGLATTNKAVEELSAVGLRATTIARLRLEVGEHPLAPGTVLIVDEVSQVSTRDAAAVLDAVAVTTGAGVWFLGDPRQGTSVAAGGIAAEVARRARDGALVAPRLVENRRQVEAADRQALSDLRAGRAAESQVIRTEHGWEHEHETPDETREAMAEAVVADIVRHGPDAVAALAVSHADCEDLTDRIRARLVDRGHVAASGITGLGWSAGERTYATGDRVLLHSALRNGSTRLHNGSVGTVVATGPAGLRARFASGEVLLPAPFVGGTRPDGTPNLSHAWARTIDGAQGGTWQAVHLLGSGNLDALSGYVGQSRSVAPTHTWNVRSEPAVDHGGVLADDRDGAEQVLAALRREPDVTFAGMDDPWPLDRRLRAEQAAHRDVLASCPENRSAKLARAEEKQDKARYQASAAEHELERARQALKDTGRMPRVRASSRAARTAADERVGRAEAGLDRCRSILSEAQVRVDELAAHQAQRDRFLQREGWRSERIAAIDDELAEHWAPVVLAAVRNDEPLAFGLDRLRDARLAYTAQLGDIRRSLPPDRTEALSEARRDLTEAKRALTVAKSIATAAAADVEHARRRHWGRRDHDAIDQANHRATQAQGRLSSATDWGEKARRAVEQETTAQRARMAALAENRHILNDLERSVRDLDHAVEHVRAERVVAMAQGTAPRHHLSDLGEPPRSIPALHAWCGIAWEVETWRDHHPHQLGVERSTDAESALGRRPEWYSDRLAWDSLAAGLADGPALTATADYLGVDHPADRIGDPSTWLAQLTSAREVHHAEHLLEREPPGLDLGR